MGLPAGLWLGMFSGPKRTKAVTGVTMVTALCQDWNYAADLAKEAAPPDRGERVSVQQAGVCA